MKKAKVWIIILFLISISLIIVFFVSRKADVNFQTVKIERGEITKSISTTGTLKYAKSVTIYPKISGIIDGVFVDFNSKVNKGTLLAVLESSSYKISMEKAKLAIMQASNSLKNYEKEYNDVKKLYEAGFKSEKELNEAKYNYENAAANYRSAILEYEEAKLNYENCFIRSPMSGIISAKNVEISTNVTTTTPLFTIVSGLNDLEIEALVDETEIGNIKNGLEVTFSVGALPGKTFKGKITQVRLNPQTIQNIVNYTVIIKVLEKGENNLLSGMTASVDIVIENRSNILRVPASVLRFQPSKDMLAKNKKPPTPLERSREGADNRKRDKDIKLIWAYERKTGELYPIPVKSGLSDGKYVEIIPLKNENLEGLEVVISARKSDKKQEKTGSPMMFGPQVPPRR